MRQHVHRLQGLNEFLCVIALIGAYRECRLLFMALAHVVDHDLCRFAFGATIGLRDHGVDHQTVTLVGERVSHEAQFAGRLAFAVQAGIGVCAGLVRFVAVRLVSVVTAVAAVICFVVFGHKAYVTSPGLDQGAVHAEVFAAEQLTFIGLRHDLVEQFDHRIMRNESLAVLAEDRGHSSRQTRYPSPQRPC